jgi:hypothetical protein
MNASTFLPLIGLDGMDVMFGPTPQMIPRMLPPQGTPKPSDKALKFITCWFFLGCLTVETTPFQGVTERDALAHISTLLKAMELGHEAKIAACAQLVDMWFEKFHWTPNP